MEDLNMAEEHIQSPESPDFATRNPIQEALNEHHLDLETRIAEQNTLMASADFQSELTYVRRFTWDFLASLKLCWFYSNRAGDYSTNSLVMMSTDDLQQSVIAASTLVENGMHTPIRRELRYIIESSIKHLYVDQQMDSHRPLPLLEERLDFLHNHVDRSSINMRGHLLLPAFDDDTTTHFLNELNDVYTQCCAYAHVSRRQIEERLELAERGRSAGFETPQELRNISRFMFRTYDLALALYFHGFGLSMTGDVFINAFDDKPEWKFHKGKYVSRISSYFDYKVERQKGKGTSDAILEFISRRSPHKSP
jgi:hypothetical protein